MKPARYGVQLVVAATVLALAPQLHAVTEGEALAGACKGCHQPSYANANAPLSNLTNFTKETLFQRLRDYRSGALEGTLMNRIARGYTVAELQRIANAIAAADRTSNPPAP